MGLFRWFKPRFALPAPKLRLIVFGTEETLPWPLQLVHPHRLWGALPGAPRALKQHPDPRRLLEQPLQPGDYIFEGPHTTVVACVEPYRRREPSASPSPVVDATELIAMGTTERDRLDGAQWAIALELAEVVAGIKEAVLYQVELADRLATLAEGVVLDQDAWRCYLPGRWRAADAIRPLDAREHVTLHTVRMDAGTRSTSPALWVHTHGLSKFGRPELELLEVPTALRDAAQELMTDLCQHLVDGTVLHPGDTVGAPHAPLFLRTAPPTWGTHYPGPSLELVDVGKDGKPAEHGASRGIEACGQSPMPRVASGARG